MLKKAKLSIGFFSLILSLLVLEIVYLNTYSKMKQSTLQAKKSFVKLSSLGDLAIVNESLLNRHRSLNTVANIYSIDGVLREYDKSTFTLNKVPNL